MTDRERIEALLSADPTRWWLAREVGEAVGLGSHDASSHLVRLRRRGLAESRTFYPPMLEWRWRKPA